MKDLEFSEIVQSGLEELGNGEDTATIRVWRKEEEVLVTDCTVFDPDAVQLSVVWNDGIWVEDCE